MKINIFPLAIISFRFFYFVVLIFILLFLLVGNILAKTGDEIRLSVSPEMFELSVERGEELFEKIKIYNQSPLPIPIEAQVTNFGAQEESGTITFFQEPVPREEEDDISYNPRKWIKIENPNFILDPKETEEVKLLIDIPENAEPGGHYAVILFEPKLPSFYFEEGQPRVLPIIGVLFLFSVEVEGLTKVEVPLTIVEFTIPEELRLKRLEHLMADVAGLFFEADEEKELLSIVEISHLSLFPRIKNNDIYHIKPSGKLEIFTMRGKKIGETEIKKTTILPGKIRRFPVKFKPELPEKLEKYLPASISNFISRNLFFGKFKSQLSLKLEGAIIEKDIEFWVFPWKAGLSTAFLFGLTILLVVRYKKRIATALFVLFKK